MQSYSLLIVSIFLSLELPLGCFAADRRDRSPPPIEMEQKRTKLAGSSESGHVETEVAGMRLEDPKNIVKVPEEPVHASWGVSDLEVEEAFAKSLHLVCIVEMGSYFKRINAEKWTELLGWSEEELLNKPYREFIHPDDLAKTMEYERYLIPTGFVNRLMCKNGIHRWFNWLRFSAGKKAVDHYSFCILIDVTVDYLLREENEKKIRILNEHLQIQSDIMKAVGDLQRLYLGELGHYGNSSNMETSFRHMIQHFVRLSESQFGFIGSVLNDEGKSTVRYKSWEAHPNLSDESQRLFQNSKQEGGLSYLDQFVQKLSLQKEYSSLAKDNPLIGQQVNQNMHFN